MGSRLKTTENHIKADDQSMVTFIIIPEYKILVEAGALGSCLVTDHRNGQSWSWWWRNQTLTALSLLIPLTLCDRS
jgi:hypothetical protein